MTDNDHARPQQTNEPREAATRTPASLHDATAHAGTNPPTLDRPQPSADSTATEGGKAEDMIAAMAERMWGDDAPRDAQR